MSNNINKFVNNILDKKLYDASKTYNNIMKDYISNFIADKTLEVSQVMFANNSNAE